MKKITVILIILVFTGAGFTIGKWYGEKTKTFYKWKASATMESFIDSGVTIEECQNGFPNENCTYDLMPEYEFDNWRLIGLAEDPNKIFMLQHKASSLSVSALGGPRENVTDMSLIVTDPANALEILIDEKSREWLSIQYDLKNSDGKVVGIVKDIGVDGTHDSIWDLIKGEYKILYAGNYYIPQYIKSEGSKKQLPCIQLEEGCVAIIEGKNGYEAEKFLASNSLLI